MRYIHQVKAKIVPRLKHSSPLFQILRKVYKLLYALDGYRKLFLTKLKGGSLGGKCPIKSYIVSSTSRFIELQNGNKFLWKPADPEHLLNVILSRNESEPPEIEILNSIIKTGDVVFDLGANFGWYAVPLVRLVGPKGFVYCFEPDNSAYQELVFNLQINFGNSRNFQAELMAVSNFDGETKLYSPRKLGSAFSSLIENYPSGRTLHQIVPVTKLDSYIKKNRIRRVDFIKCDIEGSELHFLEGAADLLAADSSPVILMEINEQDSRETFAVARKFGYQPYYLMRGKLQKLVSFNQSLPDYNFIFVKNYHLNSIRHLIL